MRQIEEIVEIIYIQELCGINIYENLERYPVLDDIINRIRKKAAEVEVSALSCCYDYRQLRAELMGLLDEFDAIASAIPEYCRSLLFFQEKLQ